MVQKNKVGKVHRRQLELVQALEYTRKLGQAVQSYSFQLESAYSEGRISYLDYKERKQRIFQDRTAEDWIRYYGACISFYEKELAREQKKTVEENPRQILSVFLLLLFMTLIGLTAYTSYDTMIGLVTNSSVENVSITDNTENVNQSQSVEGQNGSENTESAADIPNEGIGIAPGATILPEEIIINDTTETPLEINTTLIEPSIIPDNSTEKENVTHKPTKEQIDNLRKEILLEQNVSSVEPILENHEELTQYGAILGQNVLWSKRVSLTEEGLVSVDIPNTAQLVSIREVTNTGEEEIPFSKVQVNSSEGISPLESTSLGSGTVVPLSFFGGLFDTISELFQRIFTITGYTTLSPEEASENVTLIIEEPAQEIVIDYYTEAPVATEERTEFGKRVTISSDIHYENILSFTKIPEAEEAGIELYWIVNGTRQEFAYTAYDLNNNGKMDYIEWVTPHLSNETFEIELTILNVQSYPVVGGNWSVSFNTTGIAPLRIRAYNGTTWSDVTEDKDLKFLAVQCGGIQQDSTWIGENSTVLVDNYTCANLSKETSRVITSGVHTLEFMTVEDVHLISNNGTADANLTATLQVQDAEFLFCGAAGPMGCPFTSNAQITISAADNEIGSCTGLNSDSLLANDVSNATARVCNNLSYAPTNNQIKTTVEFKVPKDATAGSKSTVIVYQVLPT